MWAGMRCVRVPARTQPANLMGKESLRRACAMLVPAMLSATRTWAITPITGPRWNRTTSARDKRRSQPMSKGFWHALPAVYVNMAWVGSADDVARVPSLVRMMTFQFAVP